MSSPELNPNNRKGITVTKLTSLLLASTIMVSPLAFAKSPKDVGKIFAQITACHLAGELSKGEKVKADFAVIDRYKVASKGDWWKKQMNKGQLKELQRLEDTNKLELAIMCGIIEDKWA